MVKVFCQSFSSAKLHVKMRGSVGVSDFFGIGYINFYMPNLILN